MILPLVGFVAFVMGCLLFVFLGTFVLRWTEPRVGRSAWSVFAFVVGAWPGSIVSILFLERIGTYVRPAFISIAAILVGFVIGGILGGLVAAGLFDFAVEFLASRRT